MELKEKSVASFQLQQIISNTAQTFFSAQITSQNGEAIQISGVQITCLHPMLCILLSKHLLSCA